MSRKSIAAIIIGLLVFTATLVASNLVFRANAPSEAEIMASPQTQVKRLQQAETVQTTFQFVAIVELIITGALVYQWRKTDILPQLNYENHEEGQKKTIAPLIRSALVAGVIAFITSYVGALLDVFVYDLYGGLNTNILICPGLPAALFGMLGGFVWLKIRRNFVSPVIDLIPLIVIGIVTGSIPSACIKMLPQ